MNDGGIDEAQVNVGEDGGGARFEAAARAARLDGAPDGPRSLTAAAWVVRGFAA